MWIGRKLYNDLQSAALSRPRHKAATIPREPGGNNSVGSSLRIFVIGSTKIDVIAHISSEDLELDRLILGRFEGSETLANAAFQTLVDRYRDRPLAEYAVAPPEVEVGPTNRS